MNITLQEVGSKIQLLKENYVNNNINTEDLIDALDDLCCDIDECTGAFGMNSSDDDYYQDFETTPDFTQLEV